MNILPKKRWHVRTKDNIARVRKDEAEAAEKEKERQRRILLAEQESRTDFLRKKANAGQEQSAIPADTAESLSTKPATKEISIIENGHLNFFQDIEKAGGYIGGDNKEHVAEKKEEQEKYEKSIGLLTYLGQGSSEQTGDKPWYLRSHDERLEAAKDSNQVKEKKNKGHKNKDFLDPLNEVRQYLDLSFGKDKTKNKHSKDESKNKSRREEKKKSEQRNTAPKSSIEKMREDRLKREKAEREKARLLLEKLKGGTTHSKKTVIAVDERRNRYNSQFNPEIAKQNQSLGQDFYK